MQQNKKDQPLVNIGSASLLVIFLILCLVTFATLTLSSAVSDYRFSQKLAQRKTAYYEASNRASELLCKISETAVSYCSVLASGEAASRSASAASLEEALLSLGDGEVSLTADFTQETPTVAFTVPVDDSQALSVLLELQADASGDAAWYRILRWQTVSTAEWEGDNSLHLMQTN